MEGRKVHTSKILSLTFWDSERLSLLFFAAIILLAKHQSILCRGKRIVIGRRVNEHGNILMV